MKFNKETILDPAIINIEGTSLLLPEGWRRDGGFVWTPEFSTQANLMMRVSDPATGASGQTLPGQNFVWFPQLPFSSMQPGTNYLGSVVLPPPSHPAEGVQRAFMSGPLQHLQGAQFMWAVDLQGYTAELSRSVTDRSVHTTRLRYAFEWSGRRWEEDVYLVATFSPVQEFTFWWCGGWSVRAPAGELDRMTPLLMAVMLSVRNTFDWSAVLNHAQMEFSRNIQRQQQARINTPVAARNPSQQFGVIWAGSETPGSMWLKHKDEIRSKHRPMWNARQSALDRERIALAQVVGGMETYSSPFDSSRLQLPAGYAAYWVSREGQVVTSKDATFDPRAGSTAEWHQMMRYTPEPQGGWHSY